MGYGIFRRPPYVGKPKRKILKADQFPASRFDSPPLKRAPVPKHTYRRKKPPIAKRKIFALSQISNTPPLHKERPLWFVFRRKSPPIYRKPKLKTQLFTTTAFNAPPLRKPRLSWRLFRKQPFRKLARKVLNLAMFLKAPVVGKQIIDWVAPPTWRAQTNRAKRVAGIFFAAPPAPTPVPVVTRDTHDGVLPNDGYHRIERRKPSLRREFEEKVTERREIRRQIEALANGETPTETALARVLAPNVVPLPIDPAARIEALKAQLAQITLDAVRLAQKIKQHRAEEEQVILAILSSYE